MRIVLKVSLFDILKEKVNKIDAFLIKQQQIKKNDFCIRESLKIFKNL